MSDKVRIGLIGTGGIAHVHLRNLRAVGDAAVAALVDPDSARIDRAVSAFPELQDVPAFADHEQMLSNVELDAVLIASPHCYHRDQILAALQAGLHVLTEKPMVCTSADARLVMEEEQKAGKLVGISYQRHTDGAFRFVRRAIESGQAGDVQFVAAFQGQNWMRGTTGTWRQVAELSCGGQLNDSGSHLIDIILWVTGLQAKRVSASIQSFDREVDINSALAIDFANGATGTLSVVGNCPIWWEDITIVCSDWTFFMRQGRLTYSTGSRGEVQALESTHYGDTNPDRNFVDAIAGRMEVLAPSVCGLRTIELTEAAWRSAESGEAVYI
jgi:predicted dehydrogenase